MGCLSGIAKYLLFFFNFLIVVGGVVLIAIGAIILVNESKGIDSFTDYSVGGFAIAVGAIIFCIAFFGCCGAIKENSCMLTTYAVILIVLLILQVVLGALAFVSINKDDGKLDSAVISVVEAAFKKYVDGFNNDQRKIIDTIQKDFKCCGVRNPGYWLPYALTVPDPKYNGVPASCYKDNKETSGMYTKGCAYAFRDIIRDNIKIIGGIAIGFAAVELVGAIFAFCVRNRK